MMSLLLLLLFSMSILLQVETRRVRAGLERLHAKQNALLSLMMAIGELQRHAGSDQRSTFIATLGDNDNGFPLATQGGTHWTGVLGNTASAEETNGQAVLLNWLVSGNSAVSYETDTSLSGRGRILTPPPAEGSGAITYNPGSLSPTASQLSSLRASRAPDSPVRLLAGPGEAGDTVAAPVVDIGDNQGRYAWWIGDEGTKARVNLAMPETLASVTPEKTDLLQVPQRPERRRFDAFADITENTPEARQSIRNARKPADWENAFALDPVETSAHFHDATFLSRSVLANTRSGQLREDFSYLFAQDTPAAFRAALGFSESVPSPLLPELSGGPTWEQLYDFAQLGDGMVDDAITPRAQTDEQHGVYPVLRQLRLLMGLVVGADNFLYLTAYPVIVLANPYNTAIADARYDIQMSFASLGRLYVTRWGEVPGFQQNLGNNWPRPNEPGFFGRLVFRTPEVSFAPGEARIFTLAGQLWYDSQSGSEPFVVELENDFFPFSDAFSLLSPTGIALPAPAPAQNDPERRHAAFLAQTPGHTPPLFDGNNYEADIAGGEYDLNLHLVAETPPGQGPRLQRIERGSLYLHNLDYASDTIQVREGWMGFYPMRGFSLRFYSADDARPKGDQRDAMRPPRYPLFSQYNFRAPLISRPVPFTSNSGNPMLVQWTGTALGDEERYFSFPGSGIENPRVHWSFLEHRSEGETVGDPLGPANRQTQALFFHLPRPGKPLVSLGALQHFNASGYEGTGGRESADRTHWATPAYAIGNSLAPVEIPRTATSREASVEQRFHDLSFALNDLLWDRFHFSTLPFDSENPAEAPEFPLSFPLLEPSVPTRPLADYRTDRFGAARHLLLQGGFNVNSTSVDAWRAILSTLSATQNNGNAALDAPLPRHPNPLPGVAPATGSKLTDRPGWVGIRELGDAEITDLANAVVTGIRERGPVTRLSTFVNRRLSNDDAGRSGVLEAAINRSGIHEEVPRQVGDADLTTELPETAPFDSPSNPENAADHMLHGIPGWLTQADILQAIGPLLQARSDTFRIRAYGETVHPVSGRSGTVAILEAVVQRTPEYIQPSTDDDPALAPTAPTNIRFGRRFQIISLQWLDPSQI